MNRVKKITLTAIMTAICIVLNELVTIDIPPTSTPLMRLSLGIIPIFLTAYYAGIFYAALEGVLADILGFFIFSLGKFSFFPGFTFNALLSGLIIGFFVLIRKWMSTKKGLITLIITDTFFAIVSCAVFSYMYIFKGVIEGSSIPLLIVLVGLSLLINMIIIAYAIVTREKEDSNAIIIAFIVYQYVVSLCLTPLWNNMLAGTMYFYQWVIRMVTVPLQIMIYVLISKLLIIPLNKILIRKK